MNGQLIFFFRTVINPLCQCCYWYQRENFCYQFVFCAVQRKQAFARVLGQVYTSEYAANVLDSMNGAHVIFLCNLCAVISTLVTFNFAVHDLIKIVDRLLCAQWDIFTQPVCKIIHCHKIFYCLFW